MVKEGKIEEDKQEQEEQLKRKVVDKLSKRLLEDGYSLLSNIIIKYCSSVEND